MSTRLDSRLDLSSVLGGAFDPQRHFEALTTVPMEAPRARPARQEAAHT